MKLSTLAIISILFVPTAGNATIVVDDNRGGAFQQYLPQLEYLRQTNEQVIIRGRCESACTLALKLPNTCVMPSARLGFHRAIILPGWERRMSRLEKRQGMRWGTNILRSAIPAGMRKRVGRLTTQMKYVRGSELPARYRCR